MTVMQNQQLSVFREKEAKYQRVGSIARVNDTVKFAYDELYANAMDASPISLSLPLEADSPKEAVFFEGILPEETRRLLFAQSMHVSSNEYEKILAQLNCESIGALVLVSGDEEPTEGTYSVLNEKVLSDFAENPRRVSLSLGMTSRLSLAGAR